jgi:drug/metabolite transporter (DMT)-like permease
VTLALGCALAFGGAALAILGDAGQGSVALSAKAALPLALAALAGVAWALYSNLARRWGPEQGGAVPLFLGASALALLGLRLALPERSVWSPASVIELAALAVGPMALAYSFWDRGIRAGDHALLGLASYFVPVASLAIACGYLHVVPGWGLGLGCLLVVAGALVTRRALSLPAVPSAQLSP